MPSDASNGVRVCLDVGSDRVSVGISVRPDAVAKETDALAIISQLKSAGVLLSNKGEADIQELCRTKPGQTTRPVVVASRTPPVDDEPAYLEPLPEMASAAGESRMVKAGEPVARLVSRRIGVDGVDVFGKPIAHKPASANPSIDPSIKPSPNGQVYVSAIDGVIHVLGEGTGKTIVIHPLVRKSGDVADATLKSPGDLVVEGSVKASTLRALSAIRVSGDLEKSTLSCNGDLSVQAVREASIYVAGDFAATSISDSQVSCGGEVRVKEGSIVGGHVVAVGGLTCGWLGAPNLVKTLIEVGVDHRFRQKMEGTLPEIEAKLAKASRIRQAVEPLLRNPQPLKPHQQIRVGALLAEADVLEQSAQAQRQELRQQYEVAVGRCRNELFVAQMVYPGVTIRFAGAQTTARTPLRGPCRISLETSNNQSVIVLTPTGGSPIPLELCKLHDDWRRTAKSLAA